MSADDHMEFVLDEQLLANMKSSDNEGDDEKMEEDYLVPTSPEDYKECTLAGEDADPLQEQAAFSSDFEWLFKDSDLLVGEEQLADIVLRSEGRVLAKARKRGRPSSGSYISSNGYTWSAELNATSQEELPLPVHQACGKGPARTVSNAVESWMLLFDDDMLRQLLRFVNDQIRKRRTRGVSQRPTDLTELRSWLGLNYLCGVFRNAQYNGPLEELWTLELGNAIFRATMTLTRFEFITDCLCTEQGWDEVQRIWQKLLINSRSYYGSSSWVCVDEQPSNLDNMRLVLCCDSKTLFMANAVLLRQKVSHDKDLDQVICDFKTTGRNVTLGPRFTKLQNCQQLLQRQLSSIGMLPITSADCPKNWPENAEGCLYYDNVKIHKQQGSNHLLTCGLSAQVNASSLHALTAQTCAQFHDLAQRYSTVLATRPSQVKQPTFLKFLHHMLNTAALNAWVLLRLSPKGEALIEQRDFQRQLGLFLTQQRLQRRLLRRSTTTLVMKLQICEILGQSSQRLLSEAASDAKQTQGIGVLNLDKAVLPDGVTLSSRYGEKHRRCKPCARSKRETKARSRCQQCLAHRCGNHLISRCYECMGIASSQLPEGNLNEGTTGT
ncbi:uncharacterized protein LOC115634273 [Scaptodrosophila lebanonensis]|uniref:Uncharacterized protein LOC115634273 n=1 Tax=Drosophila lebanonensis TaxID=7225 RepID=A0A6J2UH19_DROLE|nr:uncharacterized protein LOC115634273 [Scaptodrosophila lebanonensis]